MLVSLVATLVFAELAAAVITVQIGGATRLNSLSRQRDRYSCYWDCDLVGCQIARDDDECAYDCEKICRVRYDYSAVGRSGSADASPMSPLEANSSDLKPKSDAPATTAEQRKPAEQTAASEQAANELAGGEYLWHCRWRI